MVTGTASGMPSKFVSTVKTVVEVGEAKQLTMAMFLLYLVRVSLLSPVIINAIKNKESKDNKKKKSKIKITL